jgi:hypothetical protein
MHLNNHAIPFCNDYNRGWVSIGGFSPAQSDLQCFATIRELFHELHRGQTGSTSRNVPFSTVYFG